jgi:hypothetical protein
VAFLPYFHPGWEGYHHVIQDLSHSSYMWSFVKRWPRTSLQPLWCPPYHLTYSAGIPTLW